MGENKNKPGQPKTETSTGRNKSDGRYVTLDERRNPQSYTVSESRPAPFRPTKEPPPSKK